MSAFRVDGIVERASTVVRSRVTAAAVAARKQGLGVPEISGKLLRPLVAYALVPDATRGSLGPSFWSGALAIQMVHEASLLHDDILDHADTRRGRKALQARDGTGAALVLGDHYLTSAYVVANRVRCPEFAEAFACAVHRTVAGEIHQSAARGEQLDEATYETIVRGKSGELFGACAFLASTASGALVPTELGVAIGALYQRVDDLLDYCTEAHRDKPALQDWRQRKWTFPLGIAGIARWDVEEADLLAMLREGPRPVLLRSLESVEECAARIVENAEREGGGSNLLADILESWCAAARQGVEAELRAAIDLDAAALGQAS